MNIGGECVTELHVGVLCSSTRKCLKGGGGGVVGSLSEKAVSLIVHIMGCGVKHVSVNIT